MPLQAGLLCAYFTLARRVGRPGFLAAGGAGDLVACLRLASTRAPGTTWREAGDEIACPPKNHKSCKSKSPPLQAHRRSTSCRRDEFHPKVDIHGGRRMRQRADGNEIRAGLRI